jgi:hypothetical protein
MTCDPIRKVCISNLDESIAFVGRKNEKKIKIILEKVRPPV